MERAALKELVKEADEIMDRRKKGLPVNKYVEDAVWMDLGNLSPEEREIVKEIRKGGVDMKNNEFKQYVLLECERQWNENQADEYGPWDEQSDDTKAEHYNDMHNNLRANFNLLK